MLYQFHVNKMKSLRRITRCLYEGSVFNTERAVSSRRWRHTSRFSITVPCTNVADLIMKDFGKFSNKVALVSTLWLFKYRICTRSYNLLEDIIKDIDVSDGTRSLKLLNSWRHYFFQFRRILPTLRVKISKWKYYNVFESEKRESYNSWEFRCVQFP